MNNAIASFLAAPLLRAGRLLCTGRRLCAALLLCAALPGTSAARAADEVDAAVADLQQRWAVANYEMRGKPRLTALQNLTLEAERLTAAHPGRAEAWIWSGIIHSTMAGAEGGLHALGAAKAARDDLERALALDPNALDGSAYTSLGALYYKVPGWPVGFGDKEKAEAMLRRALEINPDGIDSNFFYGDFLLEQGHRRKAREYLLRAQHAPPRPGRPLADSGRQREIAKLLDRASSS